MTEPNSEHMDSVAARVQAVDAFADMAGRLLIVGELEWRKVAEDYRLLAINVALRRQLESINAAVVLARQDLGHLAVSFIRPSLEDVIYLKFFAGLSLEESQELFITLGSWDKFRSLLAQRAFIGDEEMARLWYPKAFLEWAEKGKGDVRKSLRRLKVQYGWAGDTPSGAWIADQADERVLYDYLFAASSRAIHFSAGEILRRGWGAPDGILVTDKPEFRGHLSAFALDQLVRLYLKTMSVTMPLIEGTGLGTEEGGPNRDDCGHPVISMSFGYTATHQPYF